MAAIGANTSLRQASASNDLCVNLQGTLNHLVKGTKGNAALAVGTGNFQMLSRSCLLRTLLYFLHLHSIVELSNLEHLPTLKVKRNDNPANQYSALGMHYCAPNYLYLLFYRGNDI